MHSETNDFVGVIAVDLLEFNHVITSYHNAETFAAHWRLLRRESRWEHVVFPTNLNYLTSFTNAIPKLCFKRPPDETSNGAVKEKVQASLKHSTDQISPLLQIEFDLAFATKLA